MKFTQAIKMALKSILANRMRSFLTMLGIVIGISSVITLIGLGDGTKQSITSSIQSMGTNLLTVSLTGSKAKSLTDAELKTLQADSAIKGVAPIVTGSATAKNGTQSYTTSVEGSVPEYASVRNINVAVGRFITQDDVDNRYKVIDVGVEVLENIYPDLSATDYETLIGKSISLNGTNFEIVGILERKGTSLLGSGDNRVIMPQTTAERFVQNKNVKTYYIEAKSADDVPGATNTLNDFLAQKFNSDTSQYRVMSQSELLATSNQTLSTLTMMLAGIAAISLLVGGIGIMNIMLVSVTERTREIGIRKAIGAKRSDIMLQFLIEAVVVSCIGGLAGLALGVGISLLIPALVTALQISISPSVMLLAFGFSAAVGIVFGLYPASKASKLKPIDALSYE